MVWRGKPENVLEDVESAAFAYAIERSISCPGPKGIKAKLPFRAGAHKKEPLAPQPGIARHVILARIGAHWLVPGDFGENIGIPS